MDGLHVKITRQEEVEVNLAHGEKVLISGRWPANVTYTTEGIIIFVPEITRGGTFDKEVLCKY